MGPERGREVQFEQMACSLHNTVCQLHMDIRIPKPVPVSESRNGHFGTHVHHSSTARETLVYSSRPAPPIMFTVQCIHTVTWYAQAWADSAQCHYSLVRAVGHTLRGAKAVSMGSGILSMRRKVLLVVHVRGSLPPMLLWP